MNQENIGPAERIINTLLTYNDHAVHNRPGLIVPDRTSIVNVKWFPCSHKVENDKKIVYRHDKIGKRTNKVRIGILQDNGQIKNDAGAVVAEYRPAGLFPEVATWIYKQIAEVWKLDNEFAARWASYSFGQEHRDLKVILAAFMLVQCRKGDPVKENGQTLFFDEDFRDVGEAMMLLERNDDKYLNAKMLLRIHDFLSLSGIAEINRELGFGKSARHPFYGRWNKAVTKWLKYREENPRVLEGLVKKGFGSSVRELARRVGYKPETVKFFEILRWKQKQAEDGRRTLAIGKEVSAAENWNGLTEEEICRRIVSKKLSFKVASSLVPKEIGITRAIVAASIESGAFSDKDLIIHTPTLEDLGLLQVQDIRERWEKAIKEAEDMRAANIATRVKSKETQEKLQEASDNALKKAAEEVMRGMRLYIFVDKSGSMEGAIQAAKGYVAKFIQAFPPEQVHIAAFNTSASEIVLKHASKAGVENAFRGHVAGGGTDYGAGVRALQKYEPKTDEDTLFVFFGDEEAREFSDAVQASNLRPMAFGFVKVTGPHSYGNGNAVRETSSNLGIPCFMINESTFDDPYAIPRTIRNLVASTPVNQYNKRAVSRVSLVDTILQTKLLSKPAWA